MDAISLSVVADTIADHLDALSLKVKELASTYSNNKSEVYGLLEVIRQFKLLWMLPDAKLWNTDSWAADVEALVNQTTLLCGALKGLQPLHSCYAIELSEGSLNIISFSGSPRRKITTTVVEQRKVLNELKATLEGKCKGDKKELPMEKGALNKSISSPKRFSNTESLDAFSFDKVDTGTSTWRTCWLSLQRRWVSPLLLSPFRRPKHPRSKESSRHEEIYLKSSIHTTEEQPVCGCRECRLHATQRSRQIDFEIQRDAEKAKLEHSMLLVGIRDSTDDIGKVLIQLNKPPYSELELLEKKSMILKRALQDAESALYFASQRMDTASAERVKFVKLMESLENGGVMTPEHAATFETLWTKFAAVNELEYFTESSYYLDQITRFAEPSYIPTEQDVSNLPLRSLLPLSSLHYLTEFEETPKLPLTLHVLSAGCCTYSRRFINRTLDIQSFIFPVDLTLFYYDSENEDWQYLLPDQLVVFDSCVNSPRFGGVAVLWLVKMREFRELADGVHASSQKSRVLRECLQSIESDAEGDSQAVQLIEPQFMSTVKVKKSVHVCILDEMDVANVQRAVKETAEIVHQEVQRKQRL